MRKSAAAAALFALLSVNVAAQVFDAASIKPSPPLDSSNGPVSFGRRGGPGTTDPGRYTCNFCSVSDLISQAYDLPWFRIFPAGLPRDWFHIVATLPANTTPQQFQAMLRNFLIERFKLVAHTESREMQVFRLVVSPGGPKLTPHVERTPSEDEARKEKDAMAKRPPGYYYKLQGKTIADFAKVVEGQLSKPVADATGLAGQYDFDLFWTNDLSASDAPGSPTIYTAIQSLGLKLESHKQTLDVLVVDRVEKAPTEN